MIGWPHAGTKYYQYSITSIDENGESTPTPNPPHSGACGPEIPDYTIGLDSFIQTASSDWNPDAVIKKNTDPGATGTLGTIYNARIWEDRVYARGKPKGSQPHASSWEVKVEDVYYYSTTSTSQREITMEHEIGHAYGLDHVDYQAWPSAMANNRHVQPNDRRGMSVVTDVHTYHGNWIYSQHSDTKHKQRCGDCLGYYLQDHDLSTYKYLDENLHVLSCSLCLFQSQSTASHDSSYFTWVDLGTQHTRSCLTCQTIKNANHTYPSTWTSFSSDEHRHMCTAPGCGHYEYDDHVYPTNWTNYSTAQHRKLCTASGCGHYTYQNHSYPSTWTSYSSTQHRNMCTATGCGRYQYQNHTLSVVYMDSIRHVVNCSVCGYTLDQNHTYPSAWSDYSSSQHRHACTVCGYYAYANHTYPSSWSQYSSTQHRHMCTASGCGHYEYQNHNIIFTGSYYICTVCGYAHY